MQDNISLSENCVKCGFPETECLCDSLNKSTQLPLSVHVERRRYNKMYTLVNGFDNNVNLKPICKELKQKLACGGTVKKIPNGGERIELQGSHKSKVVEILQKLGYKAE